MKRLVVILFLGALVLSFSVWAADQVNFSGTWQQDMKLSDATPRSTRNDGGGMGGPGMGGFGGMGGGMGRGPQQSSTMLLVIQQTPTEFKITNVKGANGQDVVETFALDKKEKVETVGAGPWSPKGNKQVTKVKLEKDKFAVSVKTTYPMMGNHTVKKEYSLSNDGKLLTLKITNTMAQTYQKLVYNKQ